MSEVWKDIASFEGRYAVSNLGRVKAHAHLRHGVGMSGSGAVAYKEKILTPGTSAAGYLAVGLCGAGGRKNYLVHRLVAKAFLPNPDNRPQVNHKDGDKAHNEDSNLEWATSKENNAHAMKTGLTLPGSNAYKGKVAIGTVHGRLTVIGSLTTDKRVLCRCKCGNEKEVSRFNLGRKVRSCGCLNSETTAARNAARGGHYEVVV